MSDMSHIGFVWVLTLGLISAPLMAISFLRRDYVVLKKTQKSKSQKGGGEGGL